ncbi:mucoidy inhibitor MuiA family protein, partial [Natronospira sp.]
MFQRVALAILLGLATFFSPIGEGLADTVNHRVDSVTVYPMKAEVSRIVEFDVDGESGTLRLDGLPASLDVNALRITPIKPASLAIGQLSTQRQRGTESERAAIRELRARIEMLEAEREEVEVRLDVLALQLRLLEQATGEDRASATDWNQLASITGTLGETAESVIGERLTARREARRLDEEIEVLRDSLDDLGGEQTESRSLTMSWQAEGPGRAELQLEYVVYRAGWHADYEVHLDTGSEEVEIVHRAQIHQSSGEDWEDVTLFVSTSEPALGDQIPELSSWYIDFHQPQAAEVHQDYSLRRVPVTGSRVTAADLVGSEFSAEYRLPGRVSVPGDEEHHRFTLGRAELPVSLSLRTVPSRASHAWLFATGEFEGEVPLPMGNAHLYRDGVMVAQTEFSALVPGNEFRAGFGVDQRTTVEHKLVRDIRGSSGTFRRRNEVERLHRITITSGHDRAIPITVLDRMPVARDERIEVSLLDESERPDRQDV